MSKKTLREIVDYWLGSKNAHPATPTGITRQAMIEDFKAWHRAALEKYGERVREACAETAHNFDCDAHEGVKRMPLPAPIEEGEAT